MGMQRDLSVSKQPIQFLYDAKNIRLTAREGDSLLSITNEKGTESTDFSVSGTYLGHCLLNNYLVVFSKDDDNDLDYITRIDLSAPASTNNPKVLYDSIIGQEEHPLGFSLSNPIKAIGSYETETVQKVYWTDGRNQPRVINIANTDQSTLSNYNEYSFDFVPTLALNETIIVDKILGASGEFSPGVIQYAFTYYNKFGQESCIFYTTPLYYISFGDRGGNPEEKVDNAFIIRVDNCDENFDYLRIYSIQRTSLNAQAVCKRVQDINLREISKDSNNHINISYTDNGLNGDFIDPTELLYKGGETISAGTIEQKDNTLFFGDIEVKRHNLKEDNIGNNIAADSTIIQGTRDIYIEKISAFPYIYSNQLTAYEDNTYHNSVPCCGFKCGNTYRCGIQFQHKSGRWSEPFMIGDVEVTSKPYCAANHPEQVTLPVLKGTIPLTVMQEATSTLKDYVKVRSVVVYPSASDKKVVCQGVVCPTVYTDNNREDTKGMYAQSSWFFRPYRETTSDTVSAYINYENNKDIVTVSPRSTGNIAYTDNDSNFNPEANRALIESGPNQYPPADIREVEIQGSYNDVNRFKVDSNLVTLHSPDTDFDDFMYGYINNMEFQNMKYQIIGKSVFDGTLSSIEIQLETPKAHNSASGVIEKSFCADSSFGIVSGLFYEDWVLDDDDDKIKAYEDENSPYKWIVYPWSRTGSLNNDINRPADKGTPTAILKKKTISNLRYANTTLFNTPAAATSLTKDPQLFNSDQTTLLKIDMGSSYSSIYMGNIDTLINPDKFDALYFAFDNSNYKKEDQVTSFKSKNWWRFLGESNGTSYTHKLYRWYNSAWVALTEPSKDIGDVYQGLIMSKDSVRMKYKSTPHLLLYASNAFGWQGTSGTPSSTLPIVEVQRSAIINPFGGISEDALKANLWIPCGEPVRLDSNPVYVKNGQIVPEETSGAVASILFEYSWGDTYFQRYDCLKTYPFTHEDINQIVEIGSFMLESYINIDGRYDRNRGQSNNTNMTPQNFNLINPVYSQTNNFFSYRILDADMYKNTSYPQQITWTKEKQSGAEIDLWTNVTLASIYNMDGTKGKVEELTTFKDQIFCFQNKGVSNILFNSRVQIPTSDGVPIEISNSYKVDGYRYISDGIGCNNKLLVKKTPVGIYFIDSVSNHLFRIADGIEDITSSHNMSSWFNNEINGNTDTSLFKKLVYDDINHDVYAIKSTEALCFSETLNQFTGFYDYAGIDLIETCNHHVFTMKASNLWKMFENDDYCTFFGTPKPWNFTFISNGISEGAINLDKTFTNIEFRANVAGEGNIVDDEFIPYLPIDSLEVWNEHQHGITSLSTKSGSAAMKHYVPSNNPSSNLNRKFRIWRCDIPRDNYPVNNHTDDRGIIRVKAHPMDRMRNPWLYLKFSKSAMQTAKKIEIHDINLSFFI